MSEVAPTKKYYRKPNTKPVIDYAVGLPSRKTNYDPVIDEMATRFCLLGAMDDELARSLGVSEATVKSWRHTHPSFDAAVRAGRIEADAKVASSLYQSANGYSYTAEKVFQAKDGAVVRAEYTERFPPNVAAARYWLNNRRRDLWRDLPPVLVQNNNSQTVAVGSDPVQIGQNYQQIMDAEE